MIDKLNEMIEKYNAFYDYVETAGEANLIETFLSDLEELKKLAEEDRSRMEDYWKYKKLRSEGHRPGCALDMVELYAACRCGIDKDNI
jgi:hypothetical protein